MTTAEVMRSSIGEILGVPARARTAADFSGYLANRSALLDLDNLEQEWGADDVVAGLLAAAPRLATIATSRRALAVPGSSGTGREHQHHEARDLAEIELENFREALGWTLRSEPGAPSRPADLRTGWLERAVDLAGEDVSAGLVDSSPYRRTCWSSRANGART